MLNQPPTAPAAAPAPTSSSSRITKIHIGCPNEYNGKAETAQAWLDSVHLYLLINQALYHNDDRKIAYALSYMKKGSAAMWAEVCCQQGFTNPAFRTFITFKSNFEKAFRNANIQQEAMNWLTTTHITTGEQLQEYINQFKLNIVHATYDKVKDTATLISYFSTRIPIRIMQRVQAMDNVPTTIAGWYETAAHFHLQREIAWKIALMYRGPAPQNARPNFTHCPQTSHPTHDPNTMDIDALNLSPVERSCCLRNCLCFICKQPNCSTRNHPQEEIPACPIHNPERTRTTMTAPIATMPDESDLGRYVKELEGKGRKPDELFQLLQLAVEADEKDEASF